MSFDTGFFDVISEINQPSLSPVDRARCSASRGGLFTAPRRVGGFAWFFLLVDVRVRSRNLGRHGGRWHSLNKRHAEPRLSLDWAHQMELFAAMVRLIEATSAVLTAALKQYCGARGRADQSQKFCFSRARRRAGPFFCPFGQYFDGVSTKPRCARLREPKFRTGQRVRSIALDVNVR